jgi:hypothetical protein
MVVKQPTKQGKLMKWCTVLPSTLALVAILACVSACTSTGSDASHGKGTGSRTTADTTPGIGTVASTQPDQTPPALSRLYAPEDLRKDFRQFRTIMERRTLGLYTDRARLTALLDKAETYLSEPLARPMTELQFYRLLAPIVAELRCGHSFLSVSPGMEAHLRAEALFFPLDVRIFGDRLFVVEDGHGLGVPPGSEILELNGMAVPELIQRITSNVVTDGRDQGRPRRDAELWFASLYYSYVDTPAIHDLVLLLPGSHPDPDQSGVPVSKTIPAVRDARLAKIAQAIVYDTVGAPYSSTIKTDHAVLTVPTFAYRKPKAYYAFLDDFFTELADRQLDTLILDLRGNYGGSPAPTAELLKYLIDEPTPFFARNNPIYLAPWKKPVKPAAEAFRGTLYVLVDEAAFSMNSFLISLLRHHDIGTLVGSSTAGSWACSDAAMAATLKATGLRLKYSTQAFYTAVQGQDAGIGIAPDVPVTWTLEDHLEGRDPVLAAALVLAGIPSAD